jgi:hypothetical protein
MSSSKSKSSSNQRVFTVAPEGETQQVDVDNQDLYTKSSPTEVIFLTHLLSLKTAALIHLGLVDNEEGDIDFETASHIIDTLDVLKEKTNGNLTQEETHHLNAILYDLKRAYVQVVPQS